ncbi:uncharacterized protein [Drosophila pseudoobscura]|uniref:Uncharacterized protein isoform X2 n=1 Tax=Drosophila pseudoobscura pseudoobscura TaxID=46245 RepID=A0A6I8W6A7_DROPS|nr:uncharacterized protein LOC117184603 isoform X2 [Drosophila pseudoobscura]
MQKSRTRPTVRRAFRSSLNASPASSPSGLEKNGLRFPLEDTGLRQLWSRAADNCLPWNLLPSSLQVVSSWLGRGHVPICQSLKSPVQTC